MSREKPTRGGVGRPVPSGRTLARFDGAYLRCAGCLRIEHYRDADRDHGVMERSRGVPSTTMSTRSLKKAIRPVTSAASRSGSG
jgi:hypothetical protein